MYKCELCRTVVPPRTPARRRVLEARVKEYPYRSKVNRWINPVTGKPVWVDDPGGRGREVVREVLVCGPCAA